ncbi:electron transport complex protein RnfG [Pseudomonas sp. ok272]|uniref:RnfABCDGE type electron transport complex subunit G n=1 Tax=unclassified Pseudomonas TaxID=196821 RepID=UPI0008CF8FDD|nr:MULTISPECIES: RnfABCDGE type electron transport complex subunit G [unclassified Pseudomonas]SEN13658.1 electron transport complex protein RnfG [Pseudomonas sp. ok272]SFN06283.1 electron transport complex protein RnfG [Pseudomonas sp. ok602]
MKRTLSLLVLVILIAIGACMTVLLQRTVAPRIAAEQRLIESRNLLDMLPAERYDNHPLDQPLPFKNVELRNSTLLGGYLATLAGKPSAVILQSRVLGHEAAIDLLIVIDSHGRLLGVKTLKQAETPGLGGKIAAWPNAWLGSFSGKSLADPNDSGWALKKDQGQFDQLAGATVTSRAVINAIHDGLRYFDEHQPQWLGSGQ